jgi:hypothetical protein
MSCPDVPRAVPDTPEPPTGFSTPRQFWSAPGRCMSTSTLPEFGSDCTFTVREHAVTARTATAIVAIRIGILLC